ncbi:MAG: hypothetical protein K2G68_07275, partial [Helicobacter sp.]|nr:hypothetical protein [Helicobacter sp.]
MRCHKHSRGVVLLPLTLLVFLGALVLILGLKSESFKQDLKSMNQQILWLDLYLLSFKEQLKVELQSINPPIQDFMVFSRVIAEDFHYKAVVKRLEGDKKNLEAFYFVDIFGVYRDSS